MHLDTLIIIAYGTLALALAVGLPPSRDCSQRERLLAAALCLVTMLLGLSLAVFVGPQA